MCEPGFAVIELMPWLSRSWESHQSAGAFPAVLERLRGTPVRAAALIQGQPDAVLSARRGNTWSAKDHIGHLDDLHELDLKRATEFFERAPVLSCADPTNRATNERLHWAEPIEPTLLRFLLGRGELVAMLESATEADVSSGALHPRLQQPMRLIDWMQFVAEHDDHHLAAARAALRYAMKTAG